MLNGLNVVVGAGLWGCTVARLLAEDGQDVLLCESKPFVGGMASSYEKDGIEIHRFGTHVFHTNDATVWSFIKRFSTFNAYRHKVYACHLGRLYPFPISCNLVNSYFGVSIKASQLKAFLEEPGRMEEIVDVFMRDYTRKQWGLEIGDIDPFVLKRVPVRYDSTGEYFTDLYQGVPTEGYGAMFAAMLAHPKIRVEVSRHITFETIRGWMKDGRCVFYSGPIDQLMDYKLGPLRWRSLDFDVFENDVDKINGVSVVNYVDGDVRHTREHEFKFLHPERKSVVIDGRTVVSRENPIPWSRGKEPFYPVVSEGSRSLYAKYTALLSSCGRLVIGGRTGLYRYLNMDQVIQDAFRAAIISRAKLGLGSNERW